MITIIYYQFSSYSQINSSNEDPFLYYKFLPYYEKFKNDSNNAAILKRNKVKSVSEYRKSRAYGKYEKEICWEKKEYNRDGFLVKITNPHIIVYRGPASLDDEDKRIDSTTYSYNKENNSITYSCWVRKYPEKTNYYFNDSGKLLYVEEYEDSILESNKVINYDLENNRIITIETNEYYKINGSIFIIADNRISKILDYDHKDTSISEIYEYADSKLTIKEYDNDLEDRITTRYYNTYGKLIKEIREFNDENVSVEEYVYGSDCLKIISFDRELDSFYSILKPQSKIITYFDENGIAKTQIEKWHNNRPDIIKYIYEYYE
ncbi:MAG TPA: hypothetical protein DCY06_04705 [Bacteroidetes bacterium]|nr:hypothetical protein [Bacteroidota bacterium]